MDGAIDTDVLHKACVYGLFEQVLASIPLPVENFCVLASAKFVIRRKIERSTLYTNKSQVADALDYSLSLIKELEPTDDEIQFASELEFVAQQLNVGFDIGESQLCAIVLSRNFLCLITGDKRAIIAAESLFQNVQSLKSLESKLICLEQGFLWLLECVDPREVRKAVCSEQSMDRALTTCFCCSSEEIYPDSWKDGLNSYIRDIRSKAPTVTFKP